MLGFGVGEAVGEFGTLVGVELVGIGVVGNTLGIELVGPVVVGIDDDGIVEGLDVEGCDVVGVKVGVKLGGCNVGNSVGYREKRLFKVQSFSITTCSCRVAGLTDIASVYSEDSIYVNSIDIDFKADTVLTMSTI